MIPTSQEKLRKQVKSALHQEVSEIDPSGQMSMEQHIKMVLNLQKEFKKLTKSSKLIELINNGLQDRLDFRMANQEREIDDLRNYQHEQFNSQVQKRQEINVTIENILQRQKVKPVNNSQENTLQKLKSKNHKKSQSWKKNQEKMLLLQQRKALIQSCLKFQNLKKKFIQAKKKREQLYCNKNGEIYRRIQIQDYKKTRITGSN